MRFLFTEGEPEFEPGAQYAYRNSNFNILGLVIERATGKPYHEVLQERIYSRLGLENTHLLNFDISADDERIAHGYTQTFDGTHYHGSQAWAAGGLVSNVRDLSMLMRALVDGALFQQQATFDLMVSPAEGSHYGFGMFVTSSQQGLSYGHGGAIFGYNTKLEYFPDVDAIVSTNMTFNGYDFVVVNWLDDFCYPVLAEVRRVVQ
jgi:D-alanyl-D-alanine carboxypeptidase